MGGCVCVCVCVGVCVFVWVGQAVVDVCASAVGCARDAACAFVARLLAPPFGFARLLVPQTHILNSKPHIVNLKPLLFCSCRRFCRPPLEMTPPPPLKISCAWATGLGGEGLLCVCVCMRACAHASALASPPSPHPPSAPITTRVLCRVTKQPWAWNTSRSS